MNAEERRNFWNTLCSLSGEDIEKDMQILRESIKYPRYLYRYRGSNSIYDRGTENEQRIFIDSR